MKLPRFLSLPATGLVLLATGAVTASAATPNLPTLSLRDAITFALTNNVSIRQARADADAASATSRSSSALQKPSVSTTTYAAAGDSPNILTSSPGVMPQNVFSIPPRGFADQNVMVMAPLYTGGTRAGRAASARLLSEAAQAGVAGTRLSVASDVTQAYAEATLRSALAEVAGTQLAAEDEQVRVTGEKVRAGRLAPVDLLREQAAQAEARQGVLAAANAQALALVRLRSVLGTSQSSQITLADTLDSLAAQTPLLPTTLDEALRLARVGRPELAAAAKRVDAAGAEVRAAGGSYAPQVYAVGMADAMTNGGYGRVGYTVGVTASLPLYDGGQRRADVDAAKARRERASADLQQAEQQVEQETASAWLTWQTATAQVGAAQTGVAAATVGYDLANLRYNAGKSTAAERLDALAALGRAQGALAQAKADVVTARARLQAAVGRD